MWKKRNVPTAVVTDSVLHSQNRHAAVMDQRLARGVLLTVFCWVAAATGEASFSLPIGAAGVQLVRPGAGHRRLEVVEEAIEWLTRLEGPVFVVGIVGPYHSGKSFLANALLEAPPGRGFLVGSTVNPSTEGVWTLNASASLPRRAGHVLVLDTEVRTAAAADTVMHSPIAAAAAADTVMHSPIAGAAAAHAHVYLASMCAGVLRRACVVTALCGVRVLLCIRCSRASA